MSAARVKEPVSAIATNVRSWSISRRCIRGLHIRERYTSYLKHSRDECNSEAQSPRCPDESRPTHHPGAAIQEKEKTHFRAQLHRPRRRLARGARPPFGAARGVGAARPLPPCRSSEACV